MSLVEESEQVSYLLRVLRKEFEALKHRAGLHRTVQFEQIEIGYDPDAEKFFVNLPDH